jgi:pimeloyl-ACP methyl ester carboxylesterase
MVLKISIILSIFALFFLFCDMTLTSHSQSELQTTKHRSIVIDLGNGLETNARLNLPTNGSGPYPGVLLVPGSGAVDMNETAGYLRIDNKTGSLIYPNARPFHDIAQYLSERGFAVLQYDKRGIGANITFLDNNVWGNMTVDDLIQDAQKALNVLVKQPEVDSHKITLIGHSEGTTIVPRIAINNSDKVDNIVLMGTLAQNLLEIGKHQIMTPVRYAQEVLDTDNNGLISLQKASKDIVFNSLIGDLYPLLTQYNSAIRNGTLDRNDSQYDVNNDTFINIYEELKPILQDKMQSMSEVTNGERCNVLIGPCPIWINSQYSLTPNLDIIGNVPSDIPILILQGENDTDTPIEQAFLLQQRLTELKHPDHTLITYPDLGHLFYPSSKWITTLEGPMEQKVLEDLYEWISNPVRDFKELNILQHR